MELAKLVQSQKYKFKCNKRIESIQTKIPSLEYAMELDYMYIEIIVTTPVESKLLTFICNNFQDTADANRLYVDTQ